MALGMSEVIGESRFGTFAPNLSVSGVTALFSTAFSGFFDILLKIVELITRITRPVWAVLQTLNAREFIRFRQIE